MTTSNTISLSVNSSDRDYYCNYKFQCMKIDIEKSNIYNCDPAKPQIIDYVWLQQNPGQLFNTPLTVKEREMMLLNQRNSSCENNCFRAEDVGAVSPRLIRKGNIKSHSDVITNASIIDITLGSDCNLTCSYCTKEYSSTWRKDLIDHGDYPINTGDERYKLNAKDKTIHRLSQPIKQQSKNFISILDELELMAPHLKLVYITGGESLLQNNLFDILDKLHNVPCIEIFTGLGVNKNRLEKILTKLKQYKNVRFKISCENIGPYLEFNRYGINWDQFEINLQLIEKHEIDYSFHSTLSNLTLFGYAEFLGYYQDCVKDYDLVYQPDFMSVYIMDKTSKDNITNLLIDNPVPWNDEIFTSLQKEPDQLQVYNLKIFLKEFTKRRNISLLDFYPSSFINWLNDVV